MSYLMVYTQPFTLLTHFAYSSTLIRTYTNAPECGVALHIQLVACIAHLSTQCIIGTAKPMFVPLVLYTVEKLFHLIKPC